tara:strand:+ start:14092 stop:14370 length:279 start_codon:yes stop_codon:yes gene_type:complete
MGFEITVYVIAIMIVGSIGFVVNSMVRMNRDTNNKIKSLNKRLHDVEWTDTPTNGKQTTELPSNIFGEIDIKHPKTGEKLRAMAHFRPKKPR